MSRNRSQSASRSRSKSKSKSRSRSGSLSSTSSYENFYFYLMIHFIYFNSGRAAKAKNWTGDTGYRLHVSPLNPRTSRRDIEKIFSKFGTINEVCSK